MPLRVMRVALLCAMVVVFSACDDGGSSGGDPLLGRWERLLESQVTDRVERWVITFYEDNTFTLVHESTLDIETTPLEYKDARGGTYSVDENGRLILQGTFLDLGDSVPSSLSDVGDVKYSFVQESMLILDEEVGVMFLAPEIAHFYDGIQQNREYDLLVANDETGVLWRQVKTVLTDAAGEVVESVQELFEFRIGAGGDCTGQYEIKTKQTGSDETTIGGSFTACTYDDSQEQVKNHAGGNANVMVVSFDFEHEDLNTYDTSQSYIGVGGHYVGFDPGSQEYALPNTAYVRTMTIDQVLAAE